MPRHVNRLTTRTVYELTPIPSRRPTQVEATTQQELKVALQEILKLGDKEARSAAYLLDAGGEIKMPNWEAKAIGRYEFAPLERKRKRTKHRSQKAHNRQQSDQHQPTATSESPSHTDHNGSPLPSQ